MLARVWSGAIHEAHGHLDWNKRQLFAATADDAELLLHGQDVGVSILAGAYATGEISLTGVNGTVIPQGTRWQRADGLQYEATTEATIAAGVATADIRCTTSGSAGNAEVGTALALVSPIAGLQSAAAVAVGGVTGGADPESAESYRERILDRKRNTPQGGSEADYKRWAREIAGVTRVWIYPGWEGPGTVGIAFVTDGEADIFPGAGKVEDVQAHIDALRPVTAEAIVFAPEPEEIDFEIDLSPDTPAVRAAVEAELADLLRRIGQPGVTVPRSKLGEAISIAAGEDSHILVEPTADVVMPAGHLPVVGDITWL